MRYGLRRTERGLPYMMSGLQWRQGASGNCHLVKRGPVRRRKAAHIGRSRLWCERGRRRSVLRRKGEAWGRSFRRRIRETGNEAGQTHLQRHRPHGAPALPLGLETEGVFEVSYAVSAAQQNSRGLHVGLCTITALEGSMTSGRKVPCPRPQAREALWGRAALGGSGVGVFPKGRMSTA